MPKRIFGVPFAESEQNAVSISYLRRYVANLKTSDPTSAFSDVSAEAKQNLIHALDEYLNQIAARSQTLLAVIALFISAFLTIGSGNTYIKSVCIIWALSSLTLFYNIWLYFGVADNYASTHREYAQTVVLSFRRSLIFNANVASAFLFSCLCSAVYFSQIS